MPAVGTDEEAIGLIELDGRPASRARVRDPPPRGLSRASRRTGYRCRVNEFSRRSAGIPSVALSRRGPAAPRQNFASGGRSALHDSQRPNTSCCLPQCGQNREPGGIGWAQAAQDGTAAGAEPVPGVGPVRVRSEGAKSPPPGPGRPIRCWANTAGIIIPIPCPARCPPRPATRPPSRWPSRPFIFSSLFMSSKTPRRLLSSIACCTSSGG